MKSLSRIAKSAIIVVLSGCGSGDETKIAKAATSCIMEAYHRNHDIQGVQNVTITDLGSDKVSDVDKSDGVTSVIPFDAKFSILLRSGDGVPHDGLMHLELVRLASGQRKIRTVAMPGDEAYAAQLQLFAPWDCGVPPND